MANASKRFILIKGFEKNELDIADEQKWEMERCAGVDQRYMKCVRPHSLTLSVSFKTYHIS